LEFLEGTLLGIPFEAGDGAAHLVDDIDPFAVGMKLDVTWSRTGVDSGIRRVVWCN
jgi:hypothetical protein